MLIPTQSRAQFQRNFGNSLDNAFSKVIQHGTNYYVLGQNENTNGAPYRATVTRLNTNGTHLWTVSLNIASVWNDAVLTPTGDLLVVGSSLPLDATAQSLMGRITPSGSFSWLRAYNLPGRDAFTRIVRNPVPQSPSFPYYVAGFQNQPGGTPTTDDVVLFNLDANGTFNWKKIYNSTGDDEFFRDLEALPGSGDLLLSGNDNRGLILRTDNEGNGLSGVLISDVSFTDVVRRSAGGFYASANGFGTPDAHLMKFDDDLLLLWDVRISQLSSISQVWESPAGGIYVTGMGVFNGQSRPVIIKLLDNGPTVSWVRYLNSGNSFSGGSSWLLSSGDMAYTDERIIPGGFGGTCAYISISDLELTTCGVSDAMASLVFQNPVPDGLEPPLVDFQDFQMGTTLSVTTSLNWLQAEVCSTGPCEVSIDMIPIDSCGLVQLCAIPTGPQPYSYQWFNSQSTQCITEHLPCTPQTYSVTLTCADGSMATATQIFSATDNIPPVALCVPGFGVELLAGCEFVVTPELIDAGSTDNCQIQSMSVSPNLLSGCGVFEVFLTVTDWCNNTSTCSTGIQTAEGIPPIIMCPPNLTLTCHDDTTPNVTGFATATDNCDPSPVITYSDVVIGMLPCDGLIQRTWTATDSCGNEASCVQLINVMDNVPPTALCNSGITVYLGTPCTATVTAAMMDAGSTDNCQIQSMAVNPNTFTQCGTPLATLTVTDLCGNTATCQQTITVLDTIPPMISCPPDVTATAFFPDCEAVVHNIHAGATDNCTIQSINYAISGATTGSGVGDASGNTFQSGTSTVAYTAMDGCGNVDVCSFNVTVECDTCSCLGFSNLSFYNFLDLPDISVGCDSTSVVLPCIGSDALYSFQWALLCSDPLCMQSVDYQIVSASGGPALVSGTAVFPFLNFSYGQLSGPGNYQLILTGHCGLDSCVCIVNFTLEDCCSCGSFSEMAYEAVQDSLPMAVACGDTLAVVCDQIPDLEISGLFQCQGSQCEPYPMLNWELKDPSDTPIQSGTLQALPGFSLSMMPVWFINPGLYTLTITGQCDGEVCPPCVFYFESEGCLPPPENCCFEWVSETAGDFSVGQDIVSDAAGNVYTTGYYGGTVDFDPGPGVFNLTSSNPYNAFVLKLDAAGNFVWALGFGPGQGIGWSIALDAAGDIYVGGTFSNTCDFDPGPATHNLTANNQDGFLVKLNAAGQFLWAKQIRGMTSSTGNFNAIHSVATDGFGNVYFTGQYHGQTDFDPGPGVVILPGSNQCFVTKLDNNGNFVWAKSLRANFNGFSFAWSIATDAAGNVYTMGSFFFSVDFDPSASVFNMTSVGFQEIFILKLDPAGNFVWAKQLEGVPGGAKL